MTDDPRGSSRPDVQDGASPWAEVAQALGALGDSVARATVSVVHDEDNKARMRELAAGLASLAARLGDAAEGVASTPVARFADRAAADAGDAMQEAQYRASQAASEAGRVVTDEVQPALLAALHMANQKFKTAADDFDSVPDRDATEAGDNVGSTTQPIATGSGISAAAAAAAAAAAVAASAPAPGAAPVEEAVAAPEPFAMPEEPASVTGRFAAVISDKASSFFGGRAAEKAPEPEPEEDELSITGWLFPEGALDEAPSLTELEFEGAEAAGPDAGTARDDFGESSETAHVVETAAGDETGEAVESAEAGETSAMMETPEGGETPDRVGAVVVIEEIVVVEDAASETFVVDVDDVEFDADGEPEFLVAAEPPAGADRLSAARIAHERFLAERKIAEEAANASKARAKSGRRRGKHARRAAPPSDDTSLW